MRFKLSCEREDIEVIGEEFLIEGTAEKFAVHASVPDCPFDWSATHVETGLRIAVGDTIDDTIASAREKWNEKTPEQIENALQRGREMVAERDMVEPK